MTHDTQELVALLRTAVEFANAAAGEGLELDGLCPEEFLMLYSDATELEGWDALGQHVEDDLTAQAEEIRALKEALITIRDKREQCNRAVDCQAVARAALAGKGEA